MNRGNIYMTVEDLQKLMGIENIKTVYRHHKNIREAIKPGKPSLTIREYCEYADEDFGEIYEALRGEGV